MAYKYKNVSMIQQRFRASASADNLVDKVYEVNSGDTIILPVKISFGPMEFVEEVSEEQGKAKTKKHKGE